MNYLKAADRISKQIAEIEAEAVTIDAAADDLEKSVLLLEVGFQIEKLAEKRETLITKHDTQETHYWHKKELARAGRSKRRYRY